MSTVILDATIKYLNEILSLIMAVKDNERDDDIYLKMQPYIDTYRYDLETFSNKLIEEIKGNFLNAIHPELQDKYATYMLNEFISVVRPCILLSEMHEDAIYTLMTRLYPEDVYSEEKSRLYNRASFYTNLHDFLSTLEYQIHELLAIFAPNVYEKIKDSADLTELILSEKFKRVDDISVSNEKLTPTGKSRKKEQLTHKQQMVLANIFGLNQHHLLANLKPRQKGVILGELLNRSVDDTENMLNSETSKGDSKLNWDTEYERSRVLRFLKDNGIDLNG